MRPGFAWLALALLAAGLCASSAREAWALTIDARSVSAAGAAVPAAGRVSEARSSRDPDGVLRTHVVLVDEAGLEVARFAVPGGVEGGVRWVADGVPAFTEGERVRVALHDSPFGPTVFFDDDVTRGGFSLGSPPPPPAPTGPPPSVTLIDPTLGGAVPVDAPIVTVRGAGFGALQLDSRVTFLGLFDNVDAPVLAWSDTLIVCRVPAPGLLGTPQVLSGPVKVWTASGGWSDGSPFAGGPNFNVLWQWAGDSWAPSRLPIAMWVNPGTSSFGTDLGPIAADAASQWDVPGSYARFAYRGLTTAEAGNHESPLTPRDHQNTVQWRSRWPYPAAYLAITWSAIDTATFQRLEVDLEINGTRPWTLDPEGNPGAFDLPSTLCHEFGHWLRLGHTQHVASVMTAFIAPGDRRRQISVGDAFGASWIHPSYGTVAVPGYVDTATAVTVALTAFDRQGRGRAELSPDHIRLRAVLLPGALAGVADTGATGGATIALQNPRPGPLDPAMLVAPGAATIEPDHATDADGAATASFGVLPLGTYRIEMTVDGQLVRPAPVVHVVPSTLTLPGGAAPASAAPVFALSAARPSLLRPGEQGVIRFSLPAAGDARLEAFDVRGRRVQVLLAERLVAGAHEVSFTPTGTGGRALAAGVYFVRLAMTDAATGRALAPLTTRAVVLP